MSNVKSKTLAQQLRWQLLLVAVAFGLAIVISLSFITWRSVEFAADNLLKMEALALEKNARADTSFQLPSNQYLQAYRRWDEIPQTLAKSFSQDALKDNKVYERQLMNEAGEEAYVSLLRHVSADGFTLYILSSYSSKETDKFIDRVTTYMLRDALWLLLFIYIVLFALIYWLFRRTNEPMLLLSRWAQNLKGDGRLAPEEFPISELNALAAQLKTGVDRITEYNLREQQFLKHASHEMRTPLATIQACLDTLDYQLSGPESKTVKRALKASDNMRRLSLALLWLARESDRNIENRVLHLPGFVAEQVEEHRYLIQDRAVDIKQQVEDVEIDIEADLLQIVFANLLRNACQYTQSGMITIAMNSTSLTIQNPIELAPECVSDYQSFGLGLQLVSRICAKVGWRFDFSERDDHAKVSLDWS